VIPLGRLVPGHDLLLLTLDTLRYDVAQELHEAGRTPVLSALLGPAGWERRHSPGSFTFAAHAAFFAGFLPTPPGPGPHPRPVAMAFPGSETTAEDTLVLDAPDLATGLAGLGYHTICVGGVGFFNPATPLGRVLAAPFTERIWDPSMGVTDPDSTAHQVDATREALARLEPDRHAFVFLNVSAIHQPNRHYLPGANEDDRASHAAALEYVDGALAPLFDALAARGPYAALLCSDHGTCYGEDGHTGHRLAHEVVWTVPYAEVLGGGEA
jgi:hypothetical protein